MKLSDSHDQFNGINWRFVFDHSPGWGYFSNRFQSVYSSALYLFDLGSINEIAWSTIIGQLKAFPFHVVSNFNVHLVGCHRTGYALAKNWQTVGRLEKFFKQLRITWRSFWSVSPMLRKMICVSERYHIWYELIMNIFIYIYYVFLHIHTDTYIYIQYIDMHISILLVEKKPAPPRVPENKVFGPIIFRSFGAPPSGAGFCQPYVLPWQWWPVDPGVWRGSFSGGLASYRQIHGLSGTAIFKQTSRTTGQLSIQCSRCSFLARDGDEGEGGKRCGKKCGEWSI